MSDRPKYMLDTDICIFIQRGTHLPLAARFARMQPGDAVISPVTWGELYCGALKSQKTEVILRILTDLVSLVPIAAMRPEVGTVYGEIRCDLEKRGLPIGPNDLWIAAHAKALDATLVTNNTREFARIPHLKVENWAE